jgi:dTDP-glucose 4,6-dehydratase
MSEDVMEHNEVKQLNDYAMTKWVNEMQLRNACAISGSESVVVRLFNTYGPGEFYSPYRSVNCRFLYCGLRGLPWTVFRGHSRTSTFLGDTIRTLANITDNFRSGETYNISGTELHTIEELSDIVLEVTGARSDLVRMADSEILTTKRKLVDNSKAVRDLGHRSTVSLLEGMSLTAEWMRTVYEF